MRGLNLQGWQRLQLFTLGAIATFLVTTLAFITLGIFDESEKQSRFPSEDLVQMKARLAALEAATGDARSSINIGHKVSANDRGQAISSAEHKAALARIDLIEKRLALLESGAGSIDNRSDIREADIPKRSLAEVAAESRVDASSNTLAVSHVAETGQSQWGSEAATSIRGAFVVEPFFAEAGGQLDVDCRQSSCKLQWWLPGLAGQSQEEYYRLVSLGEYELLKLAARNAQDVGQLETVWGLEESSPHISILFTTSRK
jgi:hypothetical protein